MNVAGKVRNILRQSWYYGLDHRYRGTVEEVFEPVLRLSAEHFFRNLLTSDGTGAVRENDLPDHSC